jgi:hypothetical protein
MIDEALPCRSQFNAATIALQKVDSRIRALADAKAKFDRSEPCVMLRASET